MPQHLQHCSRHCLPRSHMSCREVPHKSSLRQLLLGVGAPAKGACYCRLHACIAPRRCSQVIFSRMGLHGIGRGGRGGRRGIRTWAGKLDEIASTVFCKETGAYIWRVTGHWSALWTRILLYVTATEQRATTGIAHMTQPTHRPGDYAPRPCRQFSHSKQDTSCLKWPPPIVSLCIRRPPPGTGVRLGKPSPPRGRSRRHPPMGRI